MNLNSKKATIIVIITIILFLSGLVVVFSKEYIFIKKDVNEEKNVPKNVKENDNIEIKNDENNELTDKLDNENTKEDSKSSFPNKENTNVINKTNEEKNVSSSNTNNEQVNNTSKVDSNQIKEEPIKQEKTQTEINNELRNQIKAKYNVTIGYKDEVEENYSSNYVNLTKLYDEQEIYNHLVKINSALSKYPNSFFSEIKNKWKQVTIYLVKNINGSAAGLTDNRNPNTVVILINTGGYLFESTLHHEIMHYIDCFLANIMGASALEESMMAFNPPGFTYGNQNNDYVYYYANPYYFISAYAKSNYKEDRAVIFEDLMFRSIKKEYYTQNNPINEKAKVISRQISKYLDCVSDNVTENWERFIAW